MPVCILGAHRSGTSPITRLLNLCGMYLGPDDQIMLADPEDNPEGYWENQLIVDFNDELLASLGGTWDDPPPVDPGWSQLPRYAAFRQRVKGLMADLEGTHIWGWKDPRNSLTLEFWLSAYPDLKLVLCLRNPLEVAASLSTGKPMRTLAFNEGLKLWATYHERIMTVVQPEQLIVTHYDTYFYDTAAEVRRVTERLGMDVNDEQIARACAEFLPGQRRNIAPRRVRHQPGIPASVVEHYRALCLDAGPVFQRMQSDTQYQLNVAEAALSRTYTRAIQADQVERQLVTIATLEEQLLSKGGLLEESTAAYRALEEVLARKDDELQRSEEAFHALEEQLLSKSGLLEESTAAYRALEEVLARKEDDLRQAVEANQQLTSAFQPMERDQTDDGDMGGSPDNVLADYERELASLSASISDYEAELTRLGSQLAGVSNDLAEQKEYGRSLEIDRAAKQRRLEAVSRELDAVNRSLAFRVTTKQLWRLRARVAPNGSRRYGILRVGKKTLRRVLLRRRNAAGQRITAEPAVAVTPSTRTTPALSTSFAPRPLAPAMPHEVVACTIVSKNYLSFARTLMQSLREKHPDIHLVTLLVDEVDGYYDPDAEPFETIRAADLNIPNWAHFAFKYSIMELNTAVKPYMLELLFDRYQARKVVYFDPDIVVFGSIHELLELLDIHSVVLIPHLATALGEDGKHSNELDILRSGTYNLGFIALGRSGEWRELLHWWQEKLYAGCVVDPDRGIFVDQRWIDFVPGMFPNVHVLRDPGYNVAYWNIKNRDLQKTATGYTVNGHPLIFFHFSGYSVNAPHKVSKHQDRYVMADLNRAYREVFADYRQRVLANGYNDTMKWPYAYGFFPDGAPVADAARSCLFKEDPRGARWPNPYDLRGDGNFRAWLTRPCIQPPARFASQYMLALHAMREDLQGVFPLPLSEDEEAFARWFVDKARDPEGQPETYHAVYLDPVRAALSGILPGPAHISEGDAESTRLGTMSTGQRDATSAFVVRRVGTDARGVNIVGYAHSETGVGQLARNMIDALRAARVPVAIQPVEEHDLARQHDRESASQLERGTPHRVNLFHVNADMTFPVHDLLDPEVYRDHYNIGYWNWELAQFPDRWDDAFSVYDELWVPSSFIQSAVEARSPIPVLAVPPPVEPKLPPEIGRSDLQLPEDSFVVLFVFDAFSVIERKNPWAVVAAFEKAFSRLERRKAARLVLKVNNLDKYPREAVRLRAEVRRVNGILIDTYLDRPQVSALIHCCDTYVSLHRSEGYGLTLAEAMYFGRPVIATAYSGNLDFMTAENSYLVSHKLVRLERDYPPYEAGNVWAEPDVEVAAEILRHVYEHRDEAKEKGRLAAEHMRIRQSPLVVGRMLDAEIRRIMKRYATPTGGRVAASVNGRR